MAVHFSPWLLLLVSTAFMASYMLTSAADEDNDDVLALAAKALPKACSKLCKKSSKAFCKPPKCGRLGVDSCKRCKRKQKKNCVKVVCGKGKVTEGSCENPGGVSAASQSGTDYTYGAMVNYTCNTGYKMTAGVTTLTCSNKKTWIGYKPTCSKVSCGNPGNVSFSSQIGTTYTYQAKVTYTCITGYEVTAGVATLTCGSSKSWIGTKPTCSKVNCGNPGNTTDTTQSGTTYTYGASVTYTCIVSYETSTLTCGSDKEWIGTKPNCSSKRIGGRDCAQLYEKGIGGSGVYQIQPFSSGAKANQLVSVYCDMQTDGGGWTVIQRRFNGSVDFNKNWDNYTNGFGNVDGEYWLGLDAIHALTADGSLVMRVDLWDYDGNTAYRQFGVFSVGNSGSYYTLNIGSGSGPAGDHFIKAINGMKKFTINGRKFTTYDSDHDLHHGDNCAKIHSAGWWWNSCHGEFNNLNGRYFTTKVDNRDAFNWYGWRRWTTLKRGEMKVRPKSFTSG